VRFRSACDLCGAANAAYGFQRPGGRAAQKPGTRPLWSCGAPACLDQARARAAAATQSPFAKKPPAQPAPPRQGSIGPDTKGQARLFD